MMYLHIACRNVVTNMRSAISMDCDRHNAALYKCKISGISSAGMEDRCPLHTNHD